MERAMFSINTAILLAVLHAAQPPALTLAVRTLPVKGVPETLLVHQDRLFVACFHGSNLSVFDTNTRQETHQLFFDAYEVPANPKAGTPRGVHRCPPGDLVVANGKVFVGQVFSDQVLVLDLKTLWVVKRLPLGGQGHFAAAADGKTVYYASNEKNAFHIIDTETYQYRTVAYPPGGRGIGCVALGPDGKRLYLGIQRGGKAPDGVERTGGNAFLAVYDLAKNAYAGTAYLAQRTQGDNSDDSIPYRLVFSPDGRLLYVGMFQSLAGVQVLDTATLRRVDHIPFQAGPKNKHFQWVDPLGLVMYRGWLLSVNRNNNEVMVVDRASLKAVARLTFAGDGHQLKTIALQGERIYLGDEAARAVHELSGRKLARLIKRAQRDGKAKLPLEVTLAAR